MINQFTLARNWGLYPLSTFRSSGSFYRFGTTLGMSDLRGLDLYGNKLASLSCYYSTSRDKNLALPVENRKMFGPETEKQFLLRKGFIASFDSSLSYINTAIEESKHYNNHK